MMMMMMRRRRRRRRRMRMRVRIMIMNSTCRNGIDSKSSLRNVYRNTKHGFKLEIHTADFFSFFARLNAIDQCLVRWK